MSISRIRVRNFKSFKDLDLPLKKFCILIGPNASGKSNFVSIFKFLKEVRISGLRNAITLQGDIDYLRNINIGSSADLSIEVISDRKAGFGIDKGKIGFIGIKSHEVNYKFGLTFSNSKPGFTVTEDRLKFACEVVKLERLKAGKIREKETLDKGQFIIRNDQGKINFEMHWQGGVDLKSEEIVPTLIDGKLLPENTILLESPLITFPFDVEMVFRALSFYAFSPNTAKESTLISGKNELEEDARNLAIVLKDILEDNEKKRKLYNLIGDVLPFVEELAFEKTLQKSLFLKMREVYSKEKFIPAFLISDGTINITAIIIALYFEKHPSSVFFEEPGRYLHPHLVSKIINMMKEVSQHKQIIVTTHNPEIVKHTKIEDILLISRNQEGFSSISSPFDKDKLRKFLDKQMGEDIGIEDLFTQNILE